MVNITRGTLNVFRVVHKESLVSAQVVECEEEPDVIYLFSSTNPNGIKIDKHIGLLAELPADEWMWDEECIKFGSIRDSEVLVAYCGDDFLFNDELINCNGTLEERTHVYTCSLDNDYSDYELKDVVISPSVIYEHEDISSACMTLSLDNSVFSGSIEYTPMNPSESLTFYVKIVAPEGLMPYNFRNLGVKVQYALLYHE